MTESYIQTVRDPEKVQTTTTDTTFIPQERHYSLNPLHPISPSGWRTFCDRWWKHWFTPSTYTRFFRNKWQRAKNGFSNEDTWDLNDYMASVIFHALVRFKKTTHGYPSTMTEEEWDTILGKMVEGWAAKIQLLNDSTYGDHCWVKKDPDDLVGDFDKELYEAWRTPLEAKWEEGSSLFCKHYDSLWD